MAELTETQKREWARLIGGKDADGRVLIEAGLINIGVEIRIVGNRLTKVETVGLTDAGRLALKEGSAVQESER